MTKPGIFLLLFLFPVLHALAQQPGYAVKVIDGDTEKPLAETMLQVGEAAPVLTSGDGQALVPGHLSETIRIKVRKLGYTEKVVRLSGDGMHLIRLQRRYAALDPVSVSNKRIDVGALLDSCIRSAKENSSKLDAFLHMDYRTLLCDEAQKDTLLDATAPVYWARKDRETWRYDPLLGAGDSLSFRTNRLTKELHSNYIKTVLCYPHTGFVAYLENLRSHIDGYRTLISGYEEEGVRCYDIVFVARINSGVKYGLKARLFGFGKNPESRRKKYLRISNIHFNTRTSEVLFYQDALIEGNFAETDDFLSTGYRNKLAERMDTLLQSRQRYSLHRIVFARYAGNPSVVTEKVTYRDNLVHEFFRGTGLPKDYTFSFSYHYDPGFSGPPPLQPVAFDPEKTIFRKLHTAE